MSRYTDRLDKMNTTKGMAQNGAVTPLAIMHNECVYNKDMYKPAFIALEKMDRNSSRDFDLLNAFVHRETSGNTTEQPSIALIVEQWKSTAKSLGSGYEKAGPVSEALLKEVAKDNSKVLETAILQRTTQTYS